MKQHAERLCLYAICSLICIFAPCVNHAWAEESGGTQFEQVLREGGDKDDNPPPSRPIDRERGERGESDDRGDSREETAVERSYMSKFGGSEEGRAFKRAALSAIGGSNLDRLIQLKNIHDATVAQSMRFGGDMSPYDALGVERDLGFLSTRFGDMKHGIQFASLSEPAIGLASGVAHGIANAGVLAATYFVPAMAPVTVVYFMDSPQQTVGQASKAAMTAIAVVIGETVYVVNHPMETYDAVAGDIKATNRAIRELVELPHRDPGSFMRMWYP